jgi:AbrB family looped-hinge helix DNA binding protein
MANAIFNGMTKLLSVDQAGRIVLPKKLREQFNLHAGSQLEIAAGSNHLELRPADRTVMLRRKNKLWVHHGRAQAPLSRAVETIREERVRSLSQARLH